MIFPIWFFYIVMLFNDPTLEEKPSDWFYAQRAYPYDSIPQTFFHKTVQSISNQRQSKKRGQAQAWKFAGPTNIGGRITDIEATSNDHNLIYVASASGGVFKTINKGQSWDPIFDQNPILTIGDMALDPFHSAILYVGTGEANGGGGSLAYEGNGIFKTLDGGNSWQYLGLEQSGSISKIIIHPQKPQIIYAAAMGNLFGKNQQRGLYKSTNGGNTWEQVFFHSDSVGVIDLAIDPMHPDTIYAATWERSRKASGIDYGGPSSGIYRSTDGGKAWIKLNKGLPIGSDIGRIGLALAPSEPNKIHAFYVDESGDFLGVFKSNNFGQDWVQTSGKINVSTFGWWFGKINVDPKNSNIIYGIGYSMGKSFDGGNQFFTITEHFNEEVHVDQHALFIYPDNTQELLLGNDGGLYTSVNGGDSWTPINNLPITQFYTCHVDYSQPQRLYGGTQDNSSMRTLSSTVDQWKIIWGGDGFVCLVDPSDNRFVYTESQYGVFVRSTDGGSSFLTALEGINANDRENWNTPVVFNPKDPTTLYLGTNRLYKSVNRAVSWTPISPSLSKDLGFRNFGTITAISVSPIDPQIIYCGTDMGEVWVTLNGGTNWQPINQGIPNRWITSIQADPLIKNKVYLTISGYRYNESQAHVFLSTNNGTNWKDISRGLPPIPCNKIIIDPSSSTHLVVATDAGIWRSWNDGQNWEILGDDLPLIVVTDLHFHAPTRKLVAATYGRGLFTYDLELQVTTSDQSLNPRGFKIYPNPTSDNVHISIESVKSSNANMEFFDIQGKRLWSQKIKLNPGENLIEKKSLPYPPGIYLFQVKFDDQSIQSVKVLRH